MKNISPTTTSSSSSATPQVPMPFIATMATTRNGLAKGIRQSRFDRDRQYAAEANALIAPTPATHRFVPHIESPISIQPSLSPSLLLINSATTSASPQTPTKNAHHQQQAQTSSPSQQQQSSEQLQRPSPTKATPAQSTPGTTTTPTLAEAPNAATTTSSTTSSSTNIILSNNNHGSFWGEYRHLSCGTLTAKLHAEPRDPLDRWSNSNNGGSGPEHKPRTVYVVLMLCLNLGIDPPDARKPEKCACVQAWVDPSKYSSPSNIPDTIIKELGDQYLQLRCKMSISKSLDPTIEHVRSALLTARRGAAGERVLVHYNGHGVPAPSKNGEIWAFSVDYKQYVPIPLTEINNYVGLPAMWVFDCSRAGLAIDHYSAVYEHIRREREASQDAATPTSSGNSLPRRRGASNSAQAQADYQPQQKRGSQIDELILLGACRGNELLPFNPDYPADVFTACLTTPIRMAVLWFCKHSALRKYPADIFQRITGDADKRATPLGELTWIYNTVTESIAYDILPLRTFQRLFRTDTMVTFLFRNFLLAERIMRSLGCHPVSYPRIPKSYKHPLWESWDLALDTFLAQIMASQPTSSSTSSSSGTGTGSSQGMSSSTTTTSAVMPTPTPTPAPRSYVHTSFLAQHINAFDSWLSFCRDFRHAPAQLSVVRHAIPSQFHRATALRLLGRFMDLGPQAVEQTITITTIAYLMRYFTNCMADIRGDIAHIWARVLAYDKRYQYDIVKEHGERFFMAMLTDPEINEQARVTAAFVLSMLMANFPEGQQACSDNHFISRTISMFSDQNKKYFASERFTQWVLLCFAKIWENNDSARYKATMCHITKVVIPNLDSRSVEVRASAVHAIATFFHPYFHPVYHQSVNEVLTECDFSFLVSTAASVTDPSPLVRREVVYAFSRFIACRLHDFAKVVQSLLAHNPKEPFTSSSKAVNAYAYAWRSLTLLAADPQQAVSDPARRLTAAIQQYVRSPAMVQEDQQLPEYKKDIPQEVLINSTFYDWACEPWILPGVPGVRRKASGEACEDEDTSAPAVKDREKKYRKYSVMYNEARDTWSTWNHAAKKDAFYQMCSLATPKDEYSTLLLFHPFENALSFANRSPTSSKITSILFANECDNTHLIVGSNDGYVKVWKNFNTVDGPARLVTSWPALPEQLQQQTGDRGGLDVLMEWHDTDKLLTCGMSKEVSLFDVTAEKYIARFPTQCSYSVTAVTSDKTESGSGKIFATGCSDGSVRMFDSRINPRDSLVRTFSEHRGCIVNVGIPALNKIVSASTAGDIKLWDPTNPQPASLKTVAHEGLCTFAMHQKASLMASGSTAQSLVLYTHEGVECKKVKYYEGFLGQRIPPVLSLAFHPHSILLATSFSDSTVYLYSPTKK